MSIVSQWAAIGRLDAANAEVGFQKADPVDMRAERPSEIGRPARRPARDENAA